MALTDQEILTAIEVGETRRFEFKGPRMRTDRTQYAEVLRAIFAMANQRAGGVVLIGVNDDRTVPGLTDEQAGTWRKQEYARRAAAAAALPAVDFDVSLRTITVEDEPKTIALIEIREVSDLPIICTVLRNSPQHGQPPILRPGALYVRTDVPESVELPDFAQMRELIDLATENAVRRFVGTADRLGMMGPDRIREVIQETVTATIAALGVAAQAPAPRQPVPPNDAALFDRQRQDFDGDE
jgi:hypothetical protein